jgi:hypothetical protein
MKLQSFIIGLGIVLTVLCGGQKASAFYDPETGRFITPDPIGYGDGMNTYTYVHNNPVNSIDPFGLLTDSQVDEQAQQTYGKGYDAKQRMEVIRKLTGDGYTIYSDDFSKTRYSPPEGVKQRKSAFIIQGGNIKDPSLFVRGSKATIAKLQNAGFDVNILKIDEQGDYFGFDSEGRSDASQPPKRNAAMIVENGIGNIRDLQQIQFFTHGGQDINLGNDGTEIGVSKTGPYSSDVRQWIFGHPVPGGVEVYIYGCDGSAQTAAALALRPGVRTVYNVRTGYEVHFHEFPQAKPFSGINNPFVPYVGKDAWEVYRHDGTVTPADAEPKNLSW